MIVNATPIMIAEDFSYYQRQIPGVLVLLGSKNEGKGYVHPLHSNSFDFDEDILLIGIQSFLNILLEF